MTTDTTTAAWELLRATDTGSISPLDVAQLRDFLRVALRAIEAHPGKLEQLQSKIETLGFLNQGLKNLSESHVRGSDQLTIELNRVRAEFAIAQEKARRDALEEAAKGICENCEHGWQPVLALSEYYHPIPNKGPELCEASEIYKLLAASNPAPAKPDGVVGGGDL